MASAFHRAPRWIRTKRSVISFDGFSIPQSASMDPNSANLLIWDWVASTVAFPRHHAASFFDGQRAVVCRPDDGDDEVLFVEQRLDLDGAPGQNIGERPNHFFFSARSLSGRRRAE